MSLFTKRGVISILLLIPLLFSFLLSPLETKAIGGGGIVGGAGQEAREHVNREGTSKGIRTKSEFRERENERFHYQLEATMHEDEKSFFLNLVGRTSDAIYTSYSENIMFWTNSIFDSNVKLGGLAVWAYELASDSYIVEFSVEAIGDEIRRHVGVFDRANPRFRTNGFLFSIFKVFALFVIIYAFYKLVWERSFIRSLGELFKFVFVLTISLLLFMNYGSFLVGMEKISTEAGGFVSGGSDRTEAFSKYLWTNFVDNPYLYLQYGTTNAERIGEERIHDLLVAPVGSGARKEIVDNEVNDLDNFHMSYESAPQKFMNSIVLMTLGVIGIFPVLVMALFIEFTQIWFILIAILAPFALIIASFPSQFGVLKRYFFELSLPLIIKIALHFLLMIFLFVLNALGDMDISANQYFLDGELKESLYGATLVFFMFIGMFLLRKRIFSMFSSGSEFIGDVREGLSGMKEGATKPVTETVKTGALVGGAVVGGVAGGGNPYTLAMGASAGKAVGDVATGGKSMSETASEGVGQYTRLKAYQDFEGHREEQRIDRDMAQKEREQQEQNKRLAEREREQKRAEQLADRGKSPEQRERDRIAEEIRLEEADRGYGETVALMDDYHVDQSAREDFYDEIQTQGLDMSGISTDVLNRHIDDGADFDNPRDFVSRLKNEQLANEQIAMAHKRQKIADFNDYLSGKNLNEAEVKDINSYLERKAIDIESIPQSVLDRVDNEVINDLATGEVDDYSSAFARGVEREVRAQESEEHRQRLLRNRTIDSNNNHGGGGDGGSNDESRQPDPTNDARQHYHNSDNQQHNERHNQQQNEQSDRLQPFDTRNNGTRNNNRGHGGGHDTSEEKTPYDFDNRNQTEDNRTHYQESARQNEHHGGTESNFSDLEPPRNTGQPEQTSDGSERQQHETQRSETQSSSSSNFSNLEPTNENMDTAESSSSTVHDIGDQDKGARTQYQEESRKSEHLNRGETSYDELE